MLLFRLAKQEIYYKEHTIHHGVVRLDGNDPVRAFLFFQDGFHHMGYHILRSIYSAFQIVCCNAQQHTPQNNSSNKSPIVWFCFWDFPCIALSSSFFYLLFLLQSTYSILLYAAPLACLSEQNMFFFPMLSASPLRIDYIFCRKTHVFHFYISSRQAPMITGQVLEKGYQHLSRFQPHA